jgi:hypothetical protein
MCMCRVAAVHYCAAAPQNRACTFKCTRLKPFKAPVWEPVSIPVEKRKRVRAEIRSSSNCNHARILRAAFTPQALR